MNGEKKFIWSKAADLDEFEKEYSFKPVTLKGIYDHNSEVQVDKIN